MHFTALFSKTHVLCSSQRLPSSTFLVAVNHNYGDRQLTLKNRNKQNESKWTKIYQSQLTSVTFDPVKTNCYFLRSPPRWLTAVKMYFVAAVDLSRAHVFEKHNIIVTLYWVMAQKVLILTKSQYYCDLFTHVVLCFMQAACICLDFLLVLRDWFECLMALRLNWKSFWDNVKKTKNNRRMCSV